MEALVYDVELKEKDKDLGDELGENISTTCKFCEKLVTIPVKTFDSHIAMGQNHFHCSFCLRHRHHHQDSDNVLLMSFKGIIGYYYFFNYRSRERSMWLSEIIDLIDEHQRVGLQNPVFSYDPEQFMWCIDFNRVGNTARKIHIEQVQETVKAILDALNPASIKFIQYPEFLKKFTDAIDLFYTQRQRPADKKILCPTLIGCVFGVPTNTDIEITKKVCPSFFLNPV